MKLKENKNIIEMLNSQDKDCVYLAVSMVRNSTNSKDSKKILKGISLHDRIKNYSDICKELDIEEITLESFNFLPEDQAKKTLNLIKIQNICKLFNNSKVINWNDSSQRKWYPWFEKTGSGWVVGGVIFSVSHSAGAPGFYLTEEDAKFCGNLFIKEYSEHLNN